MIRTAVHCRRDPFAIHGSVYDPWTDRRSFSDCIRNRYSVTNTVQRRNLVHRIFRKISKKKVRENIRILLRKDYAFYFRFFNGLCFRFFPGLFPVFFPGLFFKNCRYESAEPFPKKCPVGTFRSSRTLSRLFPDLFPRLITKKSEGFPLRIFRKNVVII